MAHFREEGWSPTLDAGMMHLRELLQLNVGKPKEVDRCTSDALPRHSSFFHGTSHRRNVVIDEERVEDDDRQ